MYCTWESIYTDHRQQTTTTHFKSFLLPDKPIRAVPGHNYYLICVVAKRMVRTYYNQFSRYFTTLYGMIHHKKGGTLRRGYGLKEQEMTM